MDNLDFRGLELDRDAAALDAPALPDDTLDHWTPEPRSDPEPVVEKPDSKPSSAPNDLLEAISKYNKQLGYSASELQMIVLDLSKLKPVEGVADPTKHLFNILKQSALTAFDQFTVLDSRSSQALSTGAQIEPMKKRLLQIVRDEEKASDEKKSVGGSLTAVLDEKLDICKKLVKESEERCDALAAVGTSLKAGVTTVPDMHDNAIDDLGSFGKKLSDQHRSLYSNFGIVSTALEEHDAFLRANQLEIDGLEARLKALRAERAKRITDAKQSNHEQKKEFLQQALELNKLSQTAVSAEKNLIDGSMRRLEAEWKNRAEQVDMARAASERDRILNLQTLATVLANWMAKKEAKLALMENLLDNAHLAEEEGLQVTFDVKRTKEDIETLRKTVDEHRILQGKVLLRLKELGYGVDSQLDDSRSIELGSDGDRVSIDGDSATRSPPMSPTMSAAPASEIPSFSSAANIGRGVGMSTGMGATQSNLRPTYGGEQFQNQSPYGNQSNQFSQQTQPAPSQNFPQSGYSQPLSQNPYSQMPSQSPYSQPPAYTQQGMPHSQYSQPQVPNSYSQPQQLPQSQFQPSYSQPMSTGYGSQSYPYSQPTPVAPSYSQPPSRPSEPTDEIQRKVIDLGFDPEIARKASAKARELNLPMKEAIEQLVAGTLFDSKPISKPAQPKPEPPDDVHRKVVDLGFDVETARKASAKAKELNLPLKEAVDRLVSGSLFDSKEPSRAAPSPAPASLPKLASQSSIPRSTTTPSPAAQAPASDAIFGSMLDIQEKSLLRKTWKPFYFVLSNGEIVYGPPSWTPSPFAPLGPDDVEEVGRIALASNWSVFEKEVEEQGFIFEVHNPRGTAGQFTLKAATSDLRSEWITRVRKTIRDLEKRSGPAPTSTTAPTTSPSPASTTSSTSSTRTPAASDANKMPVSQMVDKLVNMGFPRKHAQEAASRAINLDDAVERVMSLQSLDGAADEPPRLTSPVSHLPPPTSSLYGGASLATPSPASTHNTSSYPSTQNLPASGSFPPPASAGSGDRGMAKCGNCGSSFSYVFGTPRVQCQTCGIVNNVPSPQPNPNMGAAMNPSSLQLQCGYCKTQHEIQRGQPSFICRQCGVNNQVKN
eukprot:c10065_g1_i2.p1 GENE.c10065_g1_i2~~c10065_g1_i2.p1  ORF type:complete len:1108 (-),score=266.40 c10065_g1_i2:1546-4869(-)